MDAGKDTITNLDLDSFGGKQAAPHVSSKSGKRLKAPQLKSVDAFNNDYAEQREKVTMSSLGKRVPFPDYIQTGNEASKTLTTKKMVN